MYFFCTSGRTYFARPASSKRRRVASNCGMMSPSCVTKAETHLAHHVILSNAVARSTVIEKAKFHLQSENTHGIDIYIYIYMYIY